jgi:hypothetical protein
MLCVSCQDILTAKSERVCVDGAWGLKYHENIQAFKACAEAGCQLCLMAWYQVSEAIPETALEDPTPILYTINEWNRKDGSYELTGGCKTGDSTAYYHVEFVRSKGLPRLSAYGTIYFYQLRCSRSHSSFTGYRRKPRDRRG